jgi:methylated-DNA-protein-cysteine methyltransferase-like protein
MKKTKTIPQTEKLPVKERDFFKDVYEVVMHIPRGRVTSYGAIAKYLGTALSARMVGWAMNAAHGYPAVPAHRVVNRNGMLTGRMHFETPETMEENLMKEGVKITGHSVAEFEKLFWDPAKELGI